MGRPSASLIVPFAGPEAELAALLARLPRMRLEPGDEALVADNRPGEAPAARAPQGLVRIVRVPSPSSSYSARNVAAARATGEWLVFVDADTSPEPGLLDDFLDPPPADDVGVLAGAVDDRSERDTLVARYVTTRAKMSQRTTLSHPRGPYAQTANCAVRREAFERVGGFAEAIRSGGDADLCWRLAASGWRLEERPRARVEHRSRERLREMLDQLSRHGAGMAWLDERYPGSFPSPKPRELAGRVPRHVGRAARALGSGDPDEAAFVLLDLAGLWARDAGRRRSNAAPA